MRNQTRDANGRWNKKVKQLPCPAVKTKSMAKLNRYYDLSIQATLGLIALTENLEKRIQRLERKNRIYPSTKK